AGVRSCHRVPVLRLRGAYGGLLPVCAADRRGRGRNRRLGRRCERESGGHYALDAAAATDSRSVVGRCATGRTVPVVDPTLRQRSTGIPVHRFAASVGGG